MTRPAPPARPPATADSAATRPPSDPMPLDAHASAMVPRWYLPDRPAFTPHWYTPKVDPLFRRRVPTVQPRTPSPSDEAAGESSAEPADAELAPEAPTAAPPLAHRTPTAYPPGEQPKDFAMIAADLRGVASWYGPGFHGKDTASGEVYDQHRLTAAHPNLPMGTMIRVQNEQNGRVVWVRVNDRGPYAKGRILDLSRAAAERLQMVEQGTAPVLISVLRWPTTTDHKLGLRAYTQYVVQVAAYPQPEKAEELLERLQRQFGHTDFMLDPRPGGTLAVIAGPFDRNTDAQQVHRRLRKSGVSSMVRRYRK